MDYPTLREELDRMQKQVAAAAESFNRMVGKITVSADFAAFLAAAEREGARAAEWQRLQHRFSAVFAEPRQRQRLPKRTIVRPEVTRRIGYLAPR
jgi:hypothetical protein